MLLSDQPSAPTPNPIEAPSGNVLKDLLDAVKYILFAHPDDPVAQEHAAKLAKHG